MLSNQATDLLFAFSEIVELSDFRNLNWHHDQWAAIHLPSMEILGAARPYHMRKSVSLANVSTAEVRETVAAMECALSLTSDFRDILLSSKGMEISDQQLQQFAKNLQTAVNATSIIIEFLAVGDEDGDMAEVSFPPPPVESNVEFRADDRDLWIIAQKKNGLGNSYVSLNSLLQALLATVSVAA
jgi:hypothetical protein